ncbi:hypothetical protein MesoLj113a_58560 [Mesorhizobium sp. 113-1-2]|nr:hypothetical protein MesoLj113a_58560 [Mesorhizobium sp. 113-1-2]
MKCAPVRCASARLRFHCEMSRALSKEIMTTCFGFAGIGGAGGSARAEPAVAREASANAATRNKQGIGKLTGSWRSASRLSPKCGVGAIGLFAGLPRGKHRLAPGKHPFAPGE